MRNSICLAPCWSNNSISPMPPSDDGPYLTDVWMVLLRPDQGRLYFKMVDVITWNYLRGSVIDVRVYYKV